MKAHWLVMVGALLASCASSGPTGSDLGGPPENFLAYPALSSEGIVNTKAEYAYPSDQKDAFRTILLEEVSIIPVRLTVSLGGMGAEDAQIRLTTESMNLRLYLQDGTSFPQVDLDTFQEDLDDDELTSVRRNKFNSGHLSKEETSGFVFFAIPPGDSFEITGNQLVHSQKGITRRLDIDRSLLAFDIIIDDHPQPFFVGIRP
jgi:hypothetical protein